MEDIDYEYDWRSPIEVPNPNNKSGISKEKASFKWFKYWLMNDCTITEVAEHFKVAIATVSKIAKLFRWEERKANREDYLSRQREETLITNYKDFIEKDYKNSTMVLDGIYELIRMAFVILGIMQDDDLDIPDDLTIRDALDIVKIYPKTARTVYNQVLRNLQQPEKITKTEEEIVDNTPKPLSDVFKNSETINILDNIDYDE